MTFKELANSRYSVRTYSDRAIEKDKIDYILECARLAPSAANNQPWHFYVVSSEKGKHQIQNSYNREWFKTAPLYIIVCGDHNESWKRSNTDGKDYCYVDAAIAAEHIALSISDVGLGCCWVCNFDPVIITKILNLSKGVEPIVIFSIGYISEDSITPIKKRKSIDNLITCL